MVSGGCCSAIRVLRWINLLCFHALLPVRLHHALALLAVRAALAEARTDLEVGLLEPRVACGREATSRSRRTAEARRPRARGATAAAPPSVRQISSGNDGSSSNF